MKVKVSVKAQRSPDVVSLLLSGLEVLSFDQLMKVLQEPVELLHVFRGRTLIYSSDKHPGV